MHTVWKGSISFGLVHIPVKLFAAIENRDIQLRLLHQKCSSPIRYQRYCPVCEETVEQNEIIKGYEYEEDRFIPLQDEELQNLRGEKSKAVEIIDFIALNEIDPIYFNRSYFIGPSENGHKAYTLLKKAMEDSGKIGLARMMLHSREHLCVVRVYQKGLLLETIHYPDEVRHMNHVPGIDEEVEVKEKELKTAIQLIEQLTTEFQPEKYEDEYRNQLRAFIEKKATGNEIKKAKKTRKKANVVDLMDALQASLEETKPKKTGKKGAGKKKKASS